MCRDVTPCGNMYAPVCDEKLAGGYGGGLCGSSLMRVANEEG